MMTISTKNFAPGILRRSAKYPHIVAPYAAASTTMPIKIPKNVILSP